MATGWETPQARRCECGAADCEAQIKADTQATIRNMPLGSATPAGKCVRCDAAATAEAWFAKAY